MNLKNAAVLPAFGTNGIRERKIVTIEVVSNLKKRGYRLVRQADVFASGISLTRTKHYSKIKLNRLCQKLNVDVIFQPAIRRNKATVYFELSMFTKQGGYQAVRTQLTKKAKNSLKRTHLVSSVSASVSALTKVSKQPDRYSRYKVSKVEKIFGWENKKFFKDKPGKKPVRRIKKDKDLKNKEKAKKKQKQYSSWDKYDHSKFFIDFGFIFSWCKGQTYCAGIDRGYGGRIAIGYRVMSYIALGVDASVAAHELPITAGDITKLLEADRASIWASVSGSIRYHMVNHFILDPFVGIDFGKIWLAYAEAEEKIYDAGGYELKYTVRTLYKMNGFLVSPHLGLNLFLTPKTALGVIVKWSRPQWSEICKKIYDEDSIDTDGPSSISNPKETCESAKTHEPFKTKKPPWFLTFDIHMSFLF